MKGRWKRIEKKATHDRADRRIEQMVRFLIYCHWKEKNIYDNNLNVLENKRPCYLTPTVLEDMIKSIAFYENIHGFFFIKQAKQRGGE